MKEKRETVYVKAERNSVCLDPQIRIMDVMSVECTDPAICAEIKKKTLYHFAPEQTAKKKRIEVFSILDVIQLIHEEYPEVEVVSFGEQDFVVEYVSSPMGSKAMETLKIVVLCIVIFLGSAFTIMAFNNDVSVGEVFDRFYKEDKSRGLNVRGSGLGLHICKVLVSLSGGKIWAESQEGEWCRFSFSLPAEAPGKKVRLGKGDGSAKK